MRFRVARAGRILGEVAAFLGTARGLTWAAIACGIIFRVTDYANDRPLWDDEVYLRENVAGRPLFEFSRPLANDQLAPPGFLAMARASSRVIGTSSFGVRLIPLLCGIAGLFALAAVARRALSPRAVPIAMAVAAVSDDLIYYSTEFKQYSGDLLIACLGLFLAIDLDAKPLSTRRVATAALLGGVALWFSHPSAFVLAGAGIVLAGRAALGRRWRLLGALAILGAAWGASFAGCYEISTRMLGGSRALWTWWDFAFLRIPPRSIGEAVRLFWQVANVFTNPLGIATPLSPIGGALLGLGLFLVGAVAMARRWPWVLAMLIAPIALAMLASALHRYPFHGRVILFLVPSLLLPVAEGVEVALRRCGRVAFVALLVVLLARSSADAVEHLDRKRERMFDSHGDQRNDALDAVEAWTPSVRPLP